ncbi:MAG: hypothetical protein ACT4N4_03145 [Rhodospirillales bacterium]
MAAILASPAAAQTMRDQVWSGYDPGELQGGPHGGRQLPTVVTGNPFAIPDGEFVRIVTQAMSDAAMASSRDQTAASRAPMRVLMLFNAATYTGDRICDRGKPLAVAPPSPPAARASAAARLDLVATYCRGDRPMTQVIASLDIGGPDDPRLKNAIRQVTANLFPMTNPDRPGPDFPD